MLANSSVVGVQWGVQTKYALQQIKMTIDLNVFRTLMEYEIIRDVNSRLTVTWIRDVGTFNPREMRRFCIQSTSLIALAIAWYSAFAEEQRWYLVSQFSKRSGHYLTWQDTQWWILVTSNNYPSRSHNRQTLQEYFWLVDEFLVRVMILSTWELA